MRPFLVVLLTLGLLLAPRVGAQSVRTPPPPDSAVVHVFAVAAFHALDHWLAAVALGANGGAWTIAVPDSGDAHWLRLAAGLRHALRARAYAATDTLRAELSFELLDLRGDTLTGWIKVAGRRRCPNATWIGASTGYFVRTVRARGHWQPPTVVAGSFGDSFWCLP